MGCAWSEGDIVECAETMTPWFTKGKKYTVGGMFYSPGKEPNRVAVMSDDCGLPNGWSADKFTLVPTKIPVFNFTGTISKRIGHTSSGVYTTLQTFKSGDTVRVITDFPYFSSINKGDILTLEQYIPISDTWTVKDKKGLLWAIGAQDFELVSTSTEPAVSKTPSLTSIPHLCDNNRKTYDSGWSKYDYCEVCDKKFTD